MRVEGEGEARHHERYGASTDAAMRPFRSGSEPVRVVDISTHGCGFESRWPFREGMMALLYLPGLEPWAATIKWWEDGRGGVEFLRPLHRAVLARYIAEIAAEPRPHGPLATPG